MADGEMRYGVVLPGGSAPGQLEQAVLAERAGWDGVFVWETAYGVDAWSLLAAMAARTSRVRLGTVLTPLPWRRPWKVASQVATVDQLSGGRAILAVGVGALGTELPDTGEETGIRPRAEMLDEGIDLIRMLWDGGGEYDGQHYHFRSGASTWPRRSGRRRTALRCGSSGCGRGRSRCAGCCAVMGSSPSSGRIPAARRVCGRYGRGWPGTGRGMAWM